MKLTLVLVCAAIAVGCTLGAPAQAIDYCAVDGSVAVRPANADIAVHHKVMLLFLPKFDTSYYVAGSLRFHVDGPSGTLDLPEEGDSMGAGFTPAATGTWSAYATWSQIDCSDPDTTNQGQTPTIQFPILDELHPTRAEFKINTHLGQGRA